MSLSLLFPSGTLCIRDSLLFRERPAPASPILFPSSHLRLHCRACRQCHAAPLFRLQMLTCRRALALLRALPSLATCRREACALTAALGQQTTRHPAAHSVYPAPAPPAPVDITFASCLKKNPCHTRWNITVRREKNLPFATFSCEWQVTARSSGSSADGIRCSQLETLLYIRCILYAYSAFRRGLSLLKPQGGRGYPYGILGEFPPNPIVKA